MGLNSKQQVGFVARTAAILTNSPVATAVLDTHRTLDGWVQVNVDFTIGSLTNLLLQPQGLGSDGNWYDITDPGLLTLTATGKKMFSVNVKGMKQFRCTATGTGTVTSSSAAVWFGWQTPGGALG